MPMEDLSESLLLDRIAQATHALIQRPRELLLPFGDDIAIAHGRLKALLSQTNERALPESHRSVTTFNADLDAASLSSGYNDLMTGFQLNDENINLSVAPHKSPPSPSWTAPASHGFGNLVRSAAVHFDAAKHHLMRLACQPFDWFTRDQRLTHLQPIFALQHSRKARHIDLKDRVLLLCSCMSLANQFRDFEKTQGWASKQDILIESLLKGRDPAVQKIGKHLQSFLCTFGTATVDCSRLDAGVRLGTKLNVAQAIAKANGLSSAVPLILGFEISRLARLPYGALAELPGALASTSTGRRAATLAQVLSSWWSNCGAAYSDRFAPRTENLTPARLDVEPLMGASDLQSEEVPIPLWTFGDAQCSDSSNTGDPNLDNIRVSLEKEYDIDFNGLGYTGLSLEALMDLSSGDNRMINGRNGWDAARPCMGQLMDFEV